MNGLTDSLGSVFSFGEMLNLSNGATEDEANDITVGEEEPILVVEPWTRSLLPMDKACGLSLTAEPEKNARALTTPRKKII